jgi:Fe-S cluster assembly iron-binding protein IscA
VLTVTEAAAKAIHSLLETEGLPETGGLRITVRGEEVNIEPSHGASVDDDSVDQHGARVFFDKGSAEALEELVLDVHEHGDHVHFTLEPASG